MPPIPLHKNAPIAPTTGELPDGITPQTASTESSNNPPPTRTFPVSIPATTTSSSLSSSQNDPPPPQPGARPLPTSTYIPSSLSSPPAPQPGGSYTATHYTTETRLAGPPPQYTLPPPNNAQLAGRSTAASTVPSAPFPPGPTTLDVGGSAPPSASPYQNEHSGGAVQGRTSLEGPPGYHQAPDNTPYAPLGGTGAVGEGVGGEGESVGAAAWSMLAKAGEALKKGEEAAWKAVRNSK